MMSEPVNPADDTDHTPLSTPQPGPGGDTGGQRSGMVPDTKDGILDSQPALDAQGEKEDPDTPVGDVEIENKKSSDGSVGEKQDNEGINEDETHHQKEGTPDGEKGMTAVPDDGERDTDRSPDAGAGNVTRSTAGADGSDHDVSQTTEATKTEIQSEKNDNIQALLDRELHYLMRPERSNLYREGSRRQEEGHLEGALACYLGAITGLSEGSTFEELPRCLHAVADIYFEHKEYEKAVYFIQAEKMYYETALIDIVSVQKDSGSKAERKPSKGEGEEQHDEQLDEEPGEESSHDKSDDLDDDLSPDAKKGQEMENLARLCLKEGKLQLALDYCGKATKMYQTVYGEDHPVTIASLDLFTVIYADVGKKLYSDAMQKFEKEEEALKTERSHDTVSPDSTAPELRQRFTNNNGKDLNGVDEGTNEAMIHQGELEPTSLEERDDWVMTVLLMLIFFLATVFIVIVISSIYCYNNNRAGYCAQTRGDINYWYMYARQVIHNVRTSFR
ncbi:uncharacterized protein LOC100893473 [Strongylocentrotus purpuratus]|uniref:Consortin N-terminal domain-containing protein n=1 Tax=Strongylocentrotus purpuratus TaxID=7668 RepID=A0A7M7GIF5_STRPU|nr:uncharacterized protein LOC100893473 [Strongylocentrotus purpuratus]|eukprot:XP_003728558.1 PREDICTED: uncharacterized protein LOC100893473 [Strongylocentrotus purpuratus]